jgi:hypothetical protein
MNLTTLGLLLIDHLLGDFLFQPDAWVKDKKERKIKSKSLYYPIGIHIVLAIGGGLICNNIN